MVCGSRTERGEPAAFLALYVHMAAWVEPRTHHVLPGIKQDVGERHIVVMNLDAMKMCQGGEQTTSIPGVCAIQRSAI